MMMTWEELAEKMQSITPEQMRDEVFIFDPSMPMREDFYLVTDIGVAEKGSPADLRGMLYENQVFITMGVEKVPLTSL